MVKSILIGMNILGILFLGYIQKSPVEVSQDIPQSLKAGQDVVITVELDKSDVTGFAKYQITLDEGLRAEVVESAGASFTFNDQKAKFIWMSLPSSKTFTLKYRIIASPEAAGTYSVSSRFSYIYQNERKNHDVPAHIISIGSEAVLAEAILTPTPTPSSNTNASVLTERTVQSVGINQWEVDVVISKSDLEGFAKIEEEIPQGYTALDLNSSGAVFSLNDQTIKYIWYDLPQNEKVRVKYKLLPVVSMDGAEPNMVGSFSYLNNEETIKLPIITIGTEILAMNEPDTSIDEEPITEEDIPAEPVSEPITETIAEDVTPTPAPTPVPVVVPAVAVVSEKEPDVKEEPKAAPVAAEEQMASTAEKSPVDGNIVDVPLPETGVYYRVQIAAGKNNVKKESFSKQFGFKEDLKLENISGWFKYTTGHHQIYKSARDDRTRITAKYEKFNGPFVTAYNDGERISVQEALMITSQKWHP